MIFWKHLVYVWAGSASGKWRNMFCLGLVVVDMGYFRGWYRGCVNAMHVLLCVCIYELPVTALRDLPMLSFQATLMDPPIGE